jgi:uroporphyrinogen-III synthase
MRILVTRPEPDAADTMRTLETRGHVALCAPLLEIRFRDGPEIDLSDVAAVMITSANGIRALARRTPVRSVPVFAVGKQSAAAAEDDGFRLGGQSDGDAKALAALVKSRLRPDGGPILHACGAETRGDLAGRLTAAGYDVRTSVLYDAVAATGFPSSITAALCDGTVDAILFYSPRTAGIFAELARRDGLEAACRGIVAICISEAAAASVSDLAFRRTRIASHPSEDAILAALDQD